jgi:hypothetical protein
MQYPGWKKVCRLLIVAGLLIFFIWRLIRPMNIFVVSDEFARPMVMAVPSGLKSLKAEECGACHSEIYMEWQTSMHAKAWTDPYYQVDFAFDGSQQICLNCHIPLQNQQKNLVLGFRDSERFKPILKPNPEFDAELQQEGVTCAVCHVRNGVIIGPYGDTNAPHPTSYDPVMNGMGTCRKCHVVSGKRWDTFYRVPPCGTVAEIEEGGLDNEIDCVNCHMPSINRPLAEDAVSRQGHMHLWRGGHSQETVRSALKVGFTMTTNREGDKRVTVTLVNIGADHYLPTGTPDRHLTLEFRLKDAKGNPLRTKNYLLKRHILWRPFIVDLWDTRLARDKPRSFSFPVKPDDFPLSAELEVIVKYHLLDEARRKKIAYNNQEPISYLLYQHTELLK